MTAVDEKDTPEVKKILEDAHGIITEFEKRKKLRDAGKNIPEVVEATKAQLEEIRNPPVDVVNRTEVRSEETETRSRKATESLKPRRFEEIESSSESRGAEPIKVTVRPSKAVASAKPSAPKKAETPSVEEKSVAESSKKAAVASHGPVESTERKWEDLIRDKKVGDAVTSLEREKYNIPIAPEHVEKDAILKRFPNSDYYLFIHVSDKSFIAYRPQMKPYHWLRGTVKKSSTEVTEIEYFQPHDLEIIASRFGYGNAEQVKKELLEGPQEGQTVRSRNSTIKYSNILVKLVKNGQTADGNQFDEYVENLVRDHLDFVEKKLELSHIGWDKSTTWAYWDVCKQYYQWLKNGKTEEVKGQYFIANPLTNDIKRQQILDLTLGCYLYALFCRKDAEGFQDYWDKLSDVLRFHYDPDLLSRLVQFIGTVSVKEGKEPEQQLHSYDYIKIGKFLREAIEKAEKGDAVTPGPVSTSIPASMIGKTADLSPITSLGVHDTDPDKYKAAREAREAEVKVSPKPVAQYSKYHDEGKKTDTYLKFYPLSTAQNKKVVEIRTKCPISDLPPEVILELNANDTGLPGKVTSAYKNTYSFVVTLENGDRYLHSDFGNGKWVFVSKNEEEEKKIMEEARRFLGETPESSAAPVPTPSSGIRVRPRAAPATAPTAAPKVSKIEKDDSPLVTSEETQRRMKLIRAGKTTAKSEKTIDDLRAKVAKTSSESDTSPKTVSGSPSTSREAEPSVPAPAPAAPLPQPAALKASASSAGSPPKPPAPPSGPEEIAAFTPKEIEFILWAFGGNEDKEKDAIRKKLSEDPYTINLGKILISGGIGCLKNGIVAMAVELKQKYRSILERNNLTLIQTSNSFSWAALDICRQIFIRAKNSKGAHPDAAKTLPEITQIGIIHRHLGFELFEDYKKWKRLALNRSHPRFDEILQLLVEMRGDDQGRSHKYSTVGKLALDMTRKPPPAPAPTAILEGGKPKAEKTPDEIEQLLSSAKEDIRRAAQLEEH